MLFHNLRRLERVLTEMSTRKRGMATRRSMDDSVNPVAASQMLGLLSDCQNIPLMMLIVVVDDVCCYVILVIVVMTNLNPVKVIGHRED